MAVAPSYQESSMSDTHRPVSSFRELNLPEPLLAVLDELGYEVPTPIQVGRDPYTGSENCQQNYC